MKRIYIVCFVSIVASTLFGAGSVTLTSSNLPIILISTTNNATINDTEKIPGTMKIIFNGDGQRNAVTDTHFNYNGHIGIKLRGNSSLSFNQKQYTVETQDSLGNNLDVSLLDMPEDNDWVLNAPYNDISMIRNVFAYNMWTEMGYWGPRTRMVEVMVNGTYVGVYILTEKIKKGKERVDISKLDSTDVSGLNLTGGYIVRIDPPDSEDITFNSKVPGIGTSTTKTVVWLYYYPKSEDILTPQMNYIHSYIDTVEQVIQSATFSNPVTGYAKYINVPSFVDYFIHTELSLNADGYKRSAYFYKEKLKKDGTAGKLFAGPVWDFNLAYGNCNFCNANKVTSWVYNGCETNPVPALWKKLTQDSTFMNAVKCRYLELRQGILNENNINDYIDDYVTLLNEAQQRQFSKWTELLSTSSSGGSSWGGGTWGGGTWGGGMGTDPLWFAAYRVSSYAQEITTIKKWFADRLAFLDTNLTGVCRVSGNKDISYFNVSAYPNPAVDFVKIESSKTLNYIEIYKIDGQKLCARRLTDTNEYVVNDFRSYNKGTYIILLYSSDGSVISRRIVKQ